MPKTAEQERTKTEQTSVEASDWFRDLHPHLSPLLKAASEDEPGEGAALADAALQDALRERATDIHLDPHENNVVVRFRIDGVLLDVLVLERDVGERLIRHFKATSGLDIGASYVPKDARITEEVDGHTLDLRLAFAPGMNGLKLCIRMLDPERIEHRIGTLGFSDEDHERVVRWLEHGHGAMIAVGPAGSGKTTTLYSLLHELVPQPYSVVTVEDPVEYKIDGVTQVQVDTHHGLGLGEALKASLRLDPDYLLLGEVRDSGSAQTALEAATTGSALMTTMHGRDAVAAVTALRNFELSDFEIASTVQLVVAQRLVRKLCRNCARREKVDDDVAAWFEALDIDPPEHHSLPTGCSECQDLGYRGRTGVFEVWELTESDYKLIRNQGDEQAIRDHLEDAGFRTMVADGAEKVDRGVTSVAELVRIGGPLAGSAAARAKIPESAE